MAGKPDPSRRLMLALALCLLACVAWPAAAKAQDTVSGSFEGRVKDRLTLDDVEGARVEIVNQETKARERLSTDTEGRFYRPVLNPGSYTIRISHPRYRSLEIVDLLLVISRPTDVKTIPYGLESVQTTEARPVRGGQSPRFERAAYFYLTRLDVPAAARPAQTAAQTPAVVSARESAFTDNLYRPDGRRDGSFTQEEIATLPLGGETLTRSFDELALLLPGVARPPQTIGTNSGPGVGPGVGTSGQFSSHGLRSRANNFTMDGSDNNDEDIGVRRQGFLALVPQPVESVQEYHVITLLAPAQFGRNLGAQVNAVTRSGGDETHGALYGLFNSSQLNARNFFDTANGDEVLPALPGRNVVVSPNVVVTCLDPGALVCRTHPDPFFPARPLTVRNQSGGEDSFTLGQGGLALGGPLVPTEPGRDSSMFYFFSAEGHLLRATREASFAVPTVSQRGLFGSGATGFVIPDNPGAQLLPVGRGGGNAVFSLFPFPNNLRGVYGPNTFTQILPAGGEGKIVSGKLDANFRLAGRPQSLTARYNFTDDRRDLPVTGGALFSTLRPLVRAQNFSVFLNGRLDGAGQKLFNQLRLSYGRTRLRFEEVRDREFLLDSRFSDPTFGSFGLLNAPLLENFTSASFDGDAPTFVPNTTEEVFYLTGDPCRLTGLSGICTTEDMLGPVGRVHVAGFSPVGIDVFNFPQRRVNNTYQFADHVSRRAGDHYLVFGTDNRRTELNSELPRNARPLLTFGGVLPLPETPPEPGGLFVLPPGTVIRPEDLVAAGAASGDFLTLDLSGHPGLNLRYYQWNFFGQDEWRVRPNLTLSFGLRYEYNTPPRETSRRVEETFRSPALDLVPGLRRFIDGRERIYEPDANNFGPRVGFAYARDLFGPRLGPSVVRAGYGLYHDQVLGAVVSQSRNVFPSYLSVNLAGGIGNFGFPLSILSPVDPLLGFVREGTLNEAGLPLEELLFLVNLLTSGGGTLPEVSGAGATLPARRLEAPEAHHYAITFEQQFGRRLTLSVGYAGTRGRKLLRFTTPNLGPNAFLVVQSFAIDFGNLLPEPNALGFALSPGTRFSSADGFTGGRPVPGVGAVEIYESTARSRYDSLQVQARVRLGESLRFEAGYTLSRALDDVSDVFELAGAPALPQNSFDFAGEWAAANFDARHRFTYFFTYDLPKPGFGGALLEGFRLAGTGRYQTGQPFTVNSVFDVNLDGNLTDRPDSADGIARTGDRRQPLRLTADPLTLLAPVGRDGRVGRNAFRAGGILELDLALVKHFRLSETQSVALRVEALNFINRANFGVPVRFLEAPAFGEATETVTPGRRIQFALKYMF